jgi:transcriptional regulator with XRE-family HTH domain
MLTPATVLEVHRLLKIGALSQRQIARSLGISRGTVYAISRGKRVVRTPSPGIDRRLVRPLGEVRRCPTCGGMVQMPCLLCEVRRIRRHSFSPNDGC